MLGLRKRVRPLSRAGDRKLVEKVNNLPVPSPEELQAQREVRRHAPDYVFILLVFVLMLFGVIMIFSASYADAEHRFGNAFKFFTQQGVFVFLSVIVVLVLAVIPPIVYKKVSVLAYLASLGMLALVLVLGFTGYGAQRWIEIGPISLQPSEIAKLTVVLAMAWYYSKFTGRMMDYKKNRDLKIIADAKKRISNSLRSFIYGIVFPGLIFIIVDGLVFFENHISGIVIITLIGLSVMFCAGARTRDMIVCILIGVAGIAFIISHKEYATQRVEVWKDPYAHKLEGGWQTIQGLYAIGSGGWTGVGLGNSKMKYSYVSQPHNDFIFTIICEELGFIGALVVILLFAMLIIRGYRIASRSRDLYSSIVAFGLTSHIAIQVLLNIAVVTNAIPNTGISLPFFSYGGTSLLILSAEMGIVAAISRNTTISKEDAK